MIASDMDLLRQYASDRSEDAFARLVHQHLGLVYGVATRILRDRSLAEEVTQSAFVELARKAKTLGADTILAAWLHEVTRRKAIDAYRREQRRRKRECSAMEQASSAPDLGWDELAPLVDEGLGALGHRDRTVLILRYLQGDSLREVATALGISEDAAQKRVLRALERLRRILTRRGASIGSTGLVSALTANGAIVAPDALAQWIIAQTATALATSATAGSWFSVLPIAASGKALVATSAILAVVLNVFQALLHSQLSSDAVQLAATQTRALEDLGRAESLIANQQAEIAGLRARMDESARDKLELLRLRSEVGALRADFRASRTPQPRTGNDSTFTNDALTSWMNRVKTFKALPRDLPDRSIPELRLLTEEDWIELAKEPLGLEPQDFDFTDPLNARRALSAARAKAKNRLAWVLHRALRGFTEAHQGRIPNDVHELQPYLMHTDVEGPASRVQISSDAVGDDILSRYRVVATGLLADQKQEEPVIVEVEPVDLEYDTLLRLGNGWLQVGAIEQGSP